MLVIIVIFLPPASCLLPRTSVTSVTSVTSPPLPNWPILRTQYLQYRQYLRIRRSLLHSTHSFAFYLLPLLLPIQTTTYYCHYSSHCHFINRPIICLTTFFLPPFFFWLQNPTTHYLTLGSHARRDRLVLAYSLFPFLLFHLNSTHYSSKTTLLSDYDRHGHCLTWYIYPSLTILNHCFLIAHWTARTCYSWSISIPLLLPYCWKRVSRTFFFRIDIFSALPSKRLYLLA